MTAWPYLEVVLIDGHLKVQAGKLTQVAVSVTVLSPAIPSPASQHDMSMTLKRLRAGKQG
jgi:hypothetical protein